MSTDSNSIIFSKKENSMEHMKRMLMILGVVAAAAAVYVYVVPYIMNRRAENVEVQSMQDTLTFMQQKHQQSDQSRPSRQ